MSITKAQGIAIGASIVFCFAGMITLLWRASNLREEQDAIKERYEQFCLGVRVELQMLQVWLASSDAKLQDEAANRLYQPRGGHTSFDDLILCGAVSGYRYASEIELGLYGTCRDTKNYPCLIKLAREAELAIPRE